MRTPVVEKVIVHMGVGESGQHLVDAEEILRAITGQEVVRCFAKRTLPAFSIKKNEPIGCKVTLRGQRAQQFLETALGIVDKTLAGLSLTPLETSLSELKNTLIFRA